MIQLNKISKISKFEMKGQIWLSKLIIKKDEKLILKKDGETYKALKTFIVQIKNKEQVKKAMEVFVDTVNFDPAVFKGTIRTTKQANLREFKILWLTQLFSSGFFSQYLGFAHGIL